MVPKEAILGGGAQIRN